MNNIKKLFFAVVMLLGGFSAMGQTAERSYPLPAFSWRCSEGNALLNFNPALQLGRNTLSFDSIPYAKDYTMIIVYKTDHGDETDLWRMSFGNSLMRGQTTEKIVLGDVSIRYVGQTQVYPIINTLRQSAPDSTMPYIRLDVGGSGEMKVTEVAYYAERLDNIALRKVQTMLALRNGITLGPVDYLDGEGRRVWNYADSGLYHHRVIGVGVDNISGLRQLRSHSEMDGSVLTIATENLEDNEYLIIGDNDAPLVFEDDGEMKTLSRNWKIQATQTEDRLFTLIFDTRNMKTSSDSLVLLVDNNVYLPNNIGDDSVVFVGVKFPTDSSRFTLGCGNEFWNLAYEAMGKKEDRTDNEESVYESIHPNDAQIRFTSRIYPNPTQEHYTLEVEGADHVIVTIYNAQGILMESYTSDGHRSHKFEGDLPSGNVYYATISTENGSQTLKLVVK